MTKTQTANELRNFNLFVRKKYQHKVIRQFETFTTKTRQKC